MRTPKIKDTDLFMMLPNAPYIANLMPNHVKGQKQVGRTTGFNKHAYGGVYHYLDSRMIAEMLGIVVSKKDMISKMTSFIEDAPTFGIKGGKTGIFSATRSLDCLIKEQEKTAKMEALKKL